MAPNDGFRARDVMQTVQRRARAFVCCLLLLLPALRMAAADTIDQANAPAQPGGGAHHITVQSAQTVMPTLGCLTRVDVGLTTGNRGRGGDQVTLTVGDLYSARVYAKVTAAIPEGFDGYWRFDMPAGGVEVPRSAVVLDVRDSGKNVFWWRYEEGDPYPGGFYIFAGTGNANRDYVFKTYGKATCRAFSVNVTPDPVPLVQNGSHQATVGVARQGGFTGPVTVTFALPNGVTASPSTLVVPGASATATFKAGPAATAGSFTATANGTASGIEPAHDDFRVTVAAASGPAQITGVSPALQQKGGKITVSGTRFDPTCTSNTLTFAGVSVTPSACSAGTLTAVVPSQAAFGPTRLKVTSGAGQSNDVAFSVARQTGGFSEITSQVLHQHSTHSCSAGTARVEVTPSGGDAYRATYQRLPGNAPIGSSATFHDSYTFTVAGTTRVFQSYGGAGFSGCDVGLVFDPGNTAGPRLLLQDLDNGSAFKGSPYPIAIQVPRLTPPISQTYDPRFFRSPDGTIILAITAARENATGHVTATYFDKASGGAILKAVPINKPAGSDSVGNPSVSAVVGSNNTITLTFGNQVLPAIVIP